MKRYSYGNYSGSRRSGEVSRIVLIASRNIRNLGDNITNLKPPREPTKATTYYFYAVATRTATSREYTYVAW